MSQKIKLLKHLVLFLVPLTGFANPLHSWKNDSEGVSTRFAQGRPLVIGHRGSWGEYPENTVKGFAEAVNAGADALEFDLVLSKDGILFLSHDHEISGFTDVKIRFPEKKSQRTIGGRVVSGFFVDDFTSKELSQLKVRQRFFGRSNRYDYQDEFLSFRVFLTHFRAFERKTKKELVLFPELQSPQIFGRDKMIEQLISNLREFSIPFERVWVQSLDSQVLQKLKKQTSVKVVQLLNGNETSIPTEWLQAVKRYADAIAPAKEQIVRKINFPVPSIAPASDLVRRAHAAGLLVFPWTFRSEFYMKAVNYFDWPSDELRHFQHLGVDGLITDFPGDATTVLDSN